MGKLGLQVNASSKCPLLILARRPTFPPSTSCSLNCKVCRSCCIMWPKWYRHLWHPLGPICYSVMRLDFKRNQHPFILFMLGILSNLHFLWSFWEPLACGSTWISSTMLLLLFLLTPAWWLWAERWLSPAQTQLWMDSYQLEELHFRKMQLHEIPEIQKWPGMG